MEKLKKLIENKICFVLLGGASLEQFRQNAQKFKDFNVCWCGMNFFTLAKDHILNSIGKKFTFVFDISGVKNIIPYEKECRIPRIENYLKNESGLLVTSHEVEKNFALAKRDDIFEKYKYKILFIEDCVNLYTVHNSLMAYLFLLTYCNVKKIILFGCDGYTGEYIIKNAILSYFCPNEVRREVEIASGGSMYLGLPSDTKTFNGSFRELYVEYCTEHKLIPKRIINTNLDSFIDIFPRLDYDNLITILEDWENGKKSII